jgi:glycosyltransferase involved in cell wall biosynthesis
VVGLSLGRVCGVHDHARLLTSELEREGWRCTTHWLTREGASLSRYRRDLRDWTGSLRKDLAREPPEAVILHYSVFSYGHAGFPVFVPRVFGALAPVGAPIVGVLHEIAYPWHLDGLRGKAWAITQRLAAIEVMRRLDAAVVTTEERVAWLRTRPWLPRRPLSFAPVFSTLPPPGAGVAPDAGPPVVGMFGYSHPRSLVRLLLDGVQCLRARGTRFQLRLFGRPGSASAAADLWRGEASARGIGDMVSFSPWLPAPELADGLARCAVLLFADPGGATSRKTTLAALLASGRPAVVLDAPQTWRRMRDAEAVRLAEPTSASVAGALGALLADPAESAALAARGRAFYDTHMAVESTARAFDEALAAAQGRRPRLRQVVAAAA